MFERFSESSLEVTRLARQEAHALGSDCIASEHVILALLQQRGSAASDILASFKIDIAKVRSAIKELAQYPCASHTHPPIDKLDFTPLCVRAINAAREFSVKVNEAEVLPEHLLLGLLREKDSLAIEILGKLGVGVDDVGRQVAAGKGLGGKPPSQA